MKFKKSEIQMIGVLCTLTLLAAMNSVIFNVAMPSISTDLSISPAMASWISVGYTSIIAVGAVTYGKLSESYSVRKLLIYGVLLFSIGSIIGFIGYKSYAIILVGRVIQASGGASFVTLAMVAINQYIPTKMRGNALAFISIAIALALGIGPLLGGIITTYLGWRYLFVFMLGSMGLIIFLLKLFPNEKERAVKEPIDYLGGFLIFLVIILFLLGVNVSSPLLVLAVLTYSILLSWERKRTHPFIKVKLLKNNSFVSLICIGFVINACHLATLFILPLLFADYYQLGPNIVGCIFFLACIFSVLSSIVTRKKLTKENSTLIFYLAVASLLVGFSGLLLLWNVSFMAICFSFIFIAIGYSPIQIVLNMLVPTTLDKNDIGTGLGLYNVLNFVGMAFGPALMSKLLTDSTHYSFGFGLCILMTLGNVYLISIFKKKQKGSV